MGENKSDIAFSHVLQKTGILKNFSIAKVVPTLELEQLKLEIKKKTKNDEEFKKMFQQKIAEYSDMHDPKNPIPGIIYLDDDERRRVAYIKYAKEWAKKIKSDGATKKDLAFLIKLMINELSLTKEDFIDNKEEQPDEDEE
jgi:hypothetical protein